MPTSTYEAIATTTLTSSQTSVTFGSGGVGGAIPGTYTDLVMVVHGTSSTDTGLPYQLNDDTGSNYTNQQVYANGSNSYYERVNSATQAQSMGRINTTTGTSILHFMNYSNTTTYKHVISYGGVANTIIIVGNVTWKNTAAITKIKMMLEGAATYSSGTTFTLYGIKAA
jgi:hypothetical protein